MLALLRDTSLWLTVLADTVTTLIVAANALRLLRLKILSRSSANQMSGGHYNASNERKS